MASDQFDDERLPEGVVLVIRRNLVELVVMDWDANGGEKLSSTRMTADEARAVAECLARLADEIEQKARQG